MGVVENDENTAVGEFRAVPPGAFIEPVGNGTAAHTEGSQQGEEDVAGLGRMLCGGAQIGVELTVGKGVAQQMRGVHGERALAGPGDTGDENDARCA